MAAAYQGGGGDIEFVAMATSVMPRDAIGFTPTMPAGIAPGDLLFLVAGSDADRMTPPSTGWTERFDNDANNPRSIYYYRVATGTGDTPSLDNTGLGIRAAPIIIFSVRHANASPFPDALVSIDGASGRPDPNPIDVTYAGSMVLAIGYLDDDDAPMTAPPGYTLIASQVSGEGGTNGCTVVVAYRIVETSSVENPGAFVGSGNDSWWALTDAVRPA